MPGMRDWSPEQRAAAQDKAAETRARKKADREARKAGREAKPLRNRPAIARKQVEHGITAVIVGIDAALAYAIPMQWITPDDRLEEREVAILTEAFATEAMKSPRALRFFASLVAVTDRLGVAGALLIVALPRVTRRGLIPRQWVPFIRDLLGAATAKDFQAPEPQSDVEPMAEPEIERPEEPGPDRAAA